MQVSLQYAAEHFEDIVSAANRGEEVEISQAEKPALKLILAQHLSASAAPRKRLLGAGESRVTVGSWDEWEALNAEIDREVGEAPLMSTGEL